MDKHEASGPLTVQTLQENWHAYKGWTVYTVRTRENYCIAEVGHVDRATASTAKAYADLFAAAPELLDACELALPALVWAHENTHGGNKMQFQDIAMIVRAAIAKAKQ
jgi:hypothetical protein